MPRLVLERLRKEFNELIAVDDLSLEIEEGEFVALLGPSGCGKTTTLKMVLGLEQPTRGNVRLDGIVVNDWTPKQRKMGIVFQNYAVFPHMNAHDNIAFGLHIKNVPAAEIERQVGKMAEMLDLGEFLHRPASVLNVGELQRVAIARTLVTRPDILLLDEPLSNLEPALRGRMRAELKRLQRDLHQTAIYVTHDQVEAMSLADRIAVMDHGVLQQFDTPRNIYHKPANLFVAEFIGSPPMNLMECSLEVMNGRRYMVREGFRYDVSIYSSKLEACPSGKELVFGIRPEHIEAVSEGGAGSDIVGDVWAVEPLGSETIISSRVGTAVVRVLVDPTYPAVLGETVHLRFPPEKIHILDRKSGKSII